MDELDSAMMETYPLERLIDDKDLPVLGELLGRSFGFPPPDTPAWIERAGRDNVRIVRVGGKIAGCLFLIPMGQFFGGASVPMCGIAAVAIAAQHRGTGVATHLMRAAVNEMRELGFPLSALYPATQPLYRRAGYELAGSRYEVRVPLHRIGLAERGGALRPMTDEDRPAVEALYRTLAARRNGYLDRSGYIWTRIYNPRNQTAFGYVTQERDGYLVMFQKTVAGTGHYDIELTDIGAATTAVSRRLLSFLADHHTIGDYVAWQGDPADPLVMLLRDQTFEIRLRHHWMLRLVDVPAALAQRGYAPHVTADIHMEVEDDVVPENNGRFVLTVREGRGEAERGGQGRLRLHVRGLASLYSGFLTPWAARAAGLLEGDDADLASAAAVFAGPAPLMPDMF